MMNNGWSRALDVQMDQLKWQHTTIGTELTRGFFESILGKLERDPAVIREGTPLMHDVMMMDHNLKQTLHMGDTVYITADMQHIIMQAAHDLPEDVCFDIHNLMSQIGFVMFEETMYGEDKHGYTIAVNALAWHSAPVSEAIRNETGQDYCTVIYFFTPSDDQQDYFNRELMPKYREVGIPIPPVVLSHFYPALDGTKVPSHPNVHGSELITNLLKMFLAMQLLAQQKIGTPVKLPPDRATRKRYNREFGNDGPGRLITLITLRRKSTKKEGEAESIPWTRRWIVRGHWRKQWYPKTKTHGWKYIYEYIKGPEDKPLVITERRVFNFRR